MEKYPKLKYHVSEFYDFSSSEFEEIVGSITKRYGKSIFNYWLDDKDIDAIVLEKTEPERQLIMSYWVKEAIREFTFRCFEKQYR